MDKTVTNGNRTENKHLDFAFDSKEKGLFTLLNASDAMPQTIILNKQGAVTYNAQAQLTYEKLEVLYREALADPTGLSPEAGTETGPEKVAEEPGG